MTKVFISHSTKNRHLVEEKILRPLREAGISWWYGPDNIEGGSEWEREILRGLRSCTHFILAMTPEAAESSWVRTEVLWAVENRFDTLLPVILEPVAAEEFNLRLIALQHIDLTSPDGGEKLLRLLKSQNEQSGFAENPPDLFTSTAPQFDQIGDFFAELFDKPNSNGQNQSEADGKVTALQEAIGLEVRDDGISSFMPIFPKGSKLPSEHKEEFTTFEDSQMEVEVKPLAASGHSGEQIEPMAGYQLVAQEQPFIAGGVKQIRRLGNFALSILPQPKGVPRIDVTFHIDEEGVLDVSAIETITNRSASGIFDQVGIVEHNGSKVVISCPSCGTSFRIPGDLRVRAKCPGCDQSVVVNHGRIE